MDLIVGAPLTMGGKIFKPLRLSARPSECIFSLSQNVWNFNHLSFCRIHLLWNFIKDVMSNELAWSQYCCESTRAPSSYVSRSLVQYCRYVTSVQFTLKMKTPEYFIYVQDLIITGLFDGPLKFAVFFQKGVWEFETKRNFFLISSVQSFCQLHTSWVQNIKTIYVNLQQFCPFWTKMYGI